MVVPNSHVHCTRVPCAGLGINHRDPESHRVTGLGGFQLRPRKPVGLVLAEWPAHHDSRLVGVGVGGGFGTGFVLVSFRSRCSRSVTLVAQNRSGQVKMRDLQGDSVGPKGPIAIPDENIRRVGQVCVEAARVEIHRV